MSEGLFFGLHCNLAHEVPESREDTLRASALTGSAAPVRVPDIGRGPGR